LSGGEGFFRELKKDHLLGVRSMRFKGKVAIVTGSARGIGKEIALRLAAEGASVIISDINFDAARETAKEIERSFKTKVSPIQTDVKKTGEIHSLVKSTVRDFGRIDILVNNAGIMYPTKVEDISEEEWDEVLDVNLRGVFFCYQAVSPFMKEQRRGKILNIASVAGKIGGVASGAHYSASKAGVICLTKMFAKVLAPFGVTVNAIAPGPVDTDMSRLFSPQEREDLIKICPLGRFADTGDIAEAAIFLLSDGAKHITGEILDVNGGMLMD
jgi:NAD(P)-dependent dehydrogenase (short-subunit alcohol dehydrogenase family)